MPNMGNCCFRNTSINLSECLDALERVYDGNHRPSREEAAAGKKMFMKFLDWCRLAEIIEDFDAEVIDDLFRTEE